MTILFSIFIIIVHSFVFVLSFFLPHSFFSISKLFQSLSINWISSTPEKKISSFYQPRIDTTTFLNFPTRILLGLIGEGGFFLLIVNVSTGCVGLGAFKKQVGFCFNRERTRVRRWERKWLWRGGHGRSFFLAELLSGTVPEIGPSSRRSSEGELILLPLLHPR